MEIDNFMDVLFRTLRRREQMEEEFDQEKAEQSIKRNAIITMVAIFTVLIALYVVIKIFK